MGEEPKNPISSLLESAVTLHEIFITLMQAGFSERQSLFMIAEMIKNSAQSE